MDSRLHDTNTFSQYTPSQLAVLDIEISISRGLTIMNLMFNWWQPNFLGNDVGNALLHLAQVIVGRRTTVVLFMDKIGCLFHDLNENIRIEIVFSILQVNVQNIVTSFSFWNVCYGLWSHSVQNSLQHKSTVSNLFH